MARRHSRDWKQWTALSLKRYFDFFLQNLIIFKYCPSILSSKIGEISLCGDGNKSMYFWREYFLYDSSEAVKTVTEIIKQNDNWWLGKNKIQNKKREKKGRFLFHRINFPVVKIRGSKIEPGRCRCNEVWYWIL